MKRVFFDRSGSSRNATLSRVHSPDADDLSLTGLERSWLSNRSDVSCIPAGVYALLPWASPRYGEVWAFCGGSVTPMAEDSPAHAGRWGCLVHPANYWEQLQGCLALGKSTGEKEGDLCVWSSRRACDEFREIMGYEPLVAYVRWVV